MADELHLQINSAPGLPTHARTLNRKGVVVLHLRNFCHVYDLQHILT